MKTDHEIEQFWERVIAKRSYENADIATGATPLEEFKQHRQFLTVVLQNLNEVIARREAEEKAEEEQASQDSIG